MLSVRLHLNMFRIQHYNFALSQTNTTIINGGLIYKLFSKIKIKFLVILVFVFQIMIRLERKLTLTLKKCYKYVKIYDVIYVFLILHGIFIC